MNMMNKLILSAALMVICSVTAEAQSRRYSRPSNTYSYNSYPSNTVRVAPQPQTVYKPVVTTATPVIKTTTVTPVSHTTSTTVKAPANAFGGIESEVVSQTNAQRARYGLPPLSICPNLMGSARQHCSWMASAHSMTHTRAAVAENIAAGQHSPTDALNSWMNSSGHRANILGRGYSTIGVAAVTGSNGQTYWCQQFR